MDLTLNRIRLIRQQVLPMAPGVASQQLPAMFATDAAFLETLTTTVEIQRKHKQVVADYPIPQDMVLALQNCFLDMTAAIGIQALSAMLKLSPVMSARVALEFGSGRMEMVPRDRDGVEQGEVPIMFEVLGMILGTFGYEVFPNEDGPAHMVHFLDGVSAGYTGHQRAMEQYHQRRKQVPRIIN